MAGRYGDEGPSIRKAAADMAAVLQPWDVALKRYRDAGMTMPLLWPPFSGTPTAKTLVDMRRLVHDILPKV